ncbi:MAG: hypothetical protein ACHQHN_08410 [Sphingobacteriales bacterium]
MATNELKIIKDKDANRHEIRQHNWEVMRPFVRFSFFAMKMIAKALIGIVKTLPLLKLYKDHTPAKRS